MICAVQYIPYNRFLARLFFFQECNFCDLCRTVDSTIPYIDFLSVSPTVRPSDANVFLLFRRKNWFFLPRVIRRERAERRRDGEREREKHVNLLRGEMNTYDICGIVVITYYISKGIIFLGAPIFFRLLM